MPPHCDSLDGPVVTAARQALDAADVDRVLPFVPEENEGEVRATFERVLPVRSLGDRPREVADRLFFETVVRLHRAGEGAAYTGLKPAGLSVGPVIPRAARALETGASAQLAAFLAHVLDEQLKHRLEHVAALAAGREDSIPAARSYVEAVLGFEVFSHHLHEALLAPAHHEHG